QLEHRLGAFLFGQRAPVLGQLADLLRIDQTGVVAVREAEVAGGCAAGTRAVRRAGLALAAGGTIAAVPLTLTLALTLLLIFLFLDHLVQTNEDFALHLLRLLTAAIEVEAALDVVHLAGDPAQVLVLPR